MIIELLALEPKNGNMADRKKTWQLFAIRPKLRQTGIVELGYWLKVWAVNMDLKTINLLTIQSIRMTKFRERSAKSGRELMLEEKRDKPT